MSKLLILGAGGHGRAVSDLASEAGWTVAGHTDATGTPRPGILGSDADVERLARTGAIDAAIVGIGNSALPKRAALFRLLNDSGVAVPALVHPRAVVSRSCRVGAGSVVFAGCVLGAGVEIGVNGVCYAGVIVEHDSRIGDHCYLSPGAVVCGQVMLERGAFLGAGAVVVPGAAAGADAVKFQTFRAADLVTRAAPKAAYQRETTGGEGGQREMLARLELPADAFAALRDESARRGIIFFSSPFDEASVDVLATLGVGLFKIPSGEITNLGYLRHVAAKRRPIILSTGMSTLDEIGTAVDAIRRAGDPPLALLQCVSAYPAPAEETNLRAMDTLRERFDCPVGLSDHTTGIEVAIAAVARGAAIIEKHFTVDKTLPGPDHRASLDAAEFATLVRSIRRVEAALGDGDKRPMPSEADTRRVARKSLVAARPIGRGEKITREMIAVKRPGTGISPADLERAIGRTTVRSLAADEVIDWAALEGA